MTPARPGARRASGRMIPVLFLLLGATACQAVEEPLPSQLRATETIIGRALWQGREMLLTDAPALVAVDRVTGTLARTVIEAPPDLRFAPWGLAEADGALFTVSGFVRLMRLTPGASIAEVARLDRPLANLVDLAHGMAAQLSSEPPGSPLVVSLTGTGRIDLLESPARTGFGLTPAEESLLHLVACSTPPRVICWLPGENRLLAFDNGRLVDAAVLEGLGRIPAETLISRLDRRVITDAIATEDGRFVVLHDGGAGRPQQVSTFDARGRRLASAPAPAPLRLLVDSGGSELLVISREGRARKIRRP